MPGQIIRRVLEGLTVLALIVGVVWVWAYWWQGGAFRVAQTSMAIAASAASQPAPSASAIAMADLGQAGDMFGGFSALFSALAFVGLMIAAYLQNEQLRHARREAIEAKRSLRESERRAQEQHARQAFEPLFFQLVSLLRNQTRDMRLQTGPGSVAVGNTFDEALKYLRKQLNHSWRITLLTTAAGDNEVEGKVERVADIYKAFYTSNEGQLGPYFRTLYHALKLIHRSGLPERDKVNYANILRGLLSVDELLLIMVNCLGGMGAGLKVLVERYGLLKHLRRASMDESIAGTCFDAAATKSYLARKAHWVEHPSADLVDD